jgi:hypothetical protein
MRAKIEQLAAAGYKVNCWGVWKEQTVDHPENGKNYQRTKVCKEQGESRNAILRQVGGFGVATLKYLVTKDS